VEEEFDTISFDIEYHNDNAHLLPNQTVVLLVGGGGGARSRGRVIDALPIAQQPRRGSTTAQQKLYMIEV